MNPRIFDVNAVCIKIGKYFTQADDTIKFLFELSISWFIIDYTYEYYQYSVEYDFFIFAVGLLKTTMLFCVIIPLLTYFLFIYFGVFLIFIGMFLRLFNYLIFIFRTPYYLDMILPEE